MGRTAEHTGRTRQASYWAQTIRTECTPERGRGLGAVKDIPPWTGMVSVRPKLELQQSHHYPLCPLAGASPKCSIVLSSFPVLLCPELSNMSPWRALSVTPFFFWSMAGLMPYIVLIFMAAGT